MGPLSGLKIVEMAGIGPGPMTAMMLSDMGADVLRIERQTDSGLGIRRPEKYDLLLRGRKALALDLKNKASIEIVLDLIGRSDALIEGFRPGVMERLGLGPEICLERSPKLVFGRMTGWGQHGPLAQAAGHDLNYIALTGALNAIGRKGQLPAPPLNLLGDYAGGATYLAFGIVCAMMEAQRSGKGQVVDAAIVDGTAHLMTSIFGMHGAGMMSPRRGENVVDSGAFFYDIYECADGNLISIAPIEGKFYKELLERLGIEEADLPAQFDRAHWEAGRSVFADVIKSKSRDEWCTILEGTDVCFAPVLNLDEAPLHPHMKSRETFIEVNGVVQPAPAPRFSRTVPDRPSPPRKAENTSLAEALDGWMTAAEIEALRATGLTVQS
ncbi:CaiB/BaiF CoA transferase family protein [Bradyrhizobium sp. 195]|uniref:CaiB/BaiF CoA transferase family protein n=1 Tax=Bradyrhizobium sp. 195 TaxID=2782662 RepID=UPI002001CAA5|nr:CaiB/BaiF CoA-transferase family protein [Bradyrhizobium sp. 195]UPK29943.1 CoA transferase [Bradyrhizobium sp. 195]